jgi:hypothetical protein
MATYSHQMQDIFRKYRAEVSGEPADLRTVGAWAIANKLWAPRPVDVQAQFAHDMADALREEYRTDKKGRRYRANLAVMASKDGKQLSFWGDVDTAPRAHVEKNIQQRRRGIVNDCFQLRIDVDHYNDAHKDDPEIQLILDFKDDVEEMLVAQGLDKKAA